MKELLLIEKSKFQIKPAESAGDKKYTFEGVFTEFDSENRNGRVYTKKEFQPHFNSLQKVVEAGKCLGELDHPKVFETSLKNVSHIVEKVWMDEDNNRVMGRIKLLDTTAGKEAKALVDAGVPLHISSRAAGTVTENKTVKIHKLFTYDLVDTPGFENAVMNGVNESYGFNTNESDDYSSFAIYEIDKESKAFTKSVDTKGLNNKNNTETVEYIKENEFNEYTQFTKDTIGDMKKELNDLKTIQESIIKQNDHMVDEFNKTQDGDALAQIAEKIKTIEQWSNDVASEFERMKAGKDKVTEEVEGIPAEFEVGKQYKDYGVVTSVQNSEDGAVEVWFDSADEPVSFPVKESVEIVKDEETNKKDNKEEKESDPALMDTDIQVGKDYKGKGTITQVQRTEDGQIRIYLDSEDEPITVGAPDAGTEEIKVEESKKDEVKEEEDKDKDEVEEEEKTLDERLSAIEKTLGAIQAWSNEVTETVTAIETWSDEATTTVSGLEKWSDHVTESVTEIEDWSKEAKETVTKLQESIKTPEGNEKSTMIKESEDFASFKENIFDKIGQIVEAKKQKATDAQTINESQVENEIKDESPLWLEQIPAKYKQTWESLEEAEKTKISKRAGLRKFDTSSAIREFWNTQFSKANLIEKEETPKAVLNETQLSERRARIVENYNKSFGK